VLFDLAPKEKAEELWAYDSLLKRSKEMIQIPTPLIIVTGQRWIGKTSFAKVLFNQLPGPKVWVEGKQNPTKRQILVSVLSTLPLEQEAILSLQHLKASKLERLVEPYSNQKIWLFVDDAHLITNVRMQELLELLYDLFFKLCVVLIAPKSSIKRRILKKARFYSMFGRIKDTIQIKPFDLNISTNFLKKGFEEHKKKISNEEAEIMAKETEGVPGWLCLYGNLRLNHSRKEALHLFYKRAERKVRAALLDFFATRETARRRYEFILQGVREGYSSWSYLKSYVENKLGKTLTDSKFNHYLQALEDAAFLVKESGEYSIPDPMIRRFF